MNVLWASLELLLMLLSHHALAACAYAFVRIRVRGEIQWGVYRWLWGDESTMDQEKLFS